MNPDSPNIQAKIHLLEQEILELKKQLPRESCVHAPEEHHDIFNQAQALVEDFFNQLNFKPVEGTIQIGDERYILIRASSLSSDFFNNLEKNFPTKTKREIFSFAKDFLFDIGHVIGLEDARQFHKKMNITEPLAKLATGPVHFAHSGWAYVDILPESNPVPGEDFYLKFNHPYSFEADSWIKAGKVSKDPVCVMNAAYSSGWCEESYQIPLTSVEISCRARGDEKCTFIMAQPDQIHRFLKIERQNNPKINHFEIPYFFEKKKIEEELRKSEEMLKTAQKIAKIGSWEYDVESQRLSWSDEMYEIFEIDKLSKISLEDEYFSRVDEEDRKIIEFCFQNSIKRGKEYRLEHQIFLKEKRKKTLFCLGTPQFNEKNQVTKIYGIAQDISETVNQTRTLKINIKEKETLLKEVHHRVKNNLQIISSLLNLQSGLINNQEIVNLYKESQNRIKTIASVHELLYQSDELAQIPFSTYLKKLVNDLIISYLGADNKIKLFVNTKEKFNIDTSIPLGLLINEIVSNSLKHGLKNEASDFIYIDIFKININTYQLKIGDNGCGFDYFNNNEEPETLGLMLIKDLAEQLNGEIFKMDQKGSHFELVFKSN